MSLNSESVTPFSPMDSGLLFCCSITRDSVVRKSMKNGRFRFLLNCERL